MDKIQIPRTDLLVSKLCLGTGSMGAGIDRELSFRMLDQFCDSGGNMVDTAHVYSNWIPGEKSRSEKLLGAYLRDRGKHKVMIATKGGHPELDTMRIPRLSKQDIVADLEESLEFLGLDCIDLYWLHRDDRSRPVGDMLQTLQEQVDAGKIRYFGCSNWQIDRIEEAERYAAANGISSFVGSQIMWSLAAINPGTLGDPTLVTMDEPSLSYYKDKSLSVWAYSSQANGVFSKLEQGGEDNVKAGVKRKYLNECTLARLEEARRIAQQLSSTVTAVTLAYLTSQPFPTIPIIGCKSLEQLEQSLAAGSLLLSTDLVERLEKAGTPS